jgi:predicted site-specific integrase-resolvase
MIGVSASTLKRWEKKGILVPHRYPSGTRYYTADHLETALGVPAESRSTEYRAFLSKEIPRLSETGIEAGEVLKLAHQSWAKRTSVST